MTTQWSPDGPLDTPYRRARQEWDARMGSAVVHAKNWRLATFASMAAVLLATGGMIYLGALAQGGAAHHRGRPAGRRQLPRAGRASRLRPVRRRHHLPPAALHRGHARDLLGPRGPQAQLARRLHAAHAARGPHALGVRAEAGERPVPARAGRARHGRDPLARCAWPATPGRSIGASRPGTRTARPWARPSSGARCCARSLQAPKTAEAMKTNPIGLYIDELHWDKVGG